MSEPRSPAGGAPCEHVVGAAGDGGGAGEKPYADGAERPHIRRRRGLAAGELFGRHPCGSAHLLATRQRIRADEAGCAEIDQDRAPFPQPDMSRLDVAMHDPAGMQMREERREFPENGADCGGIGAEPATDPIDEPVIQLLESDPVGPAPEKAGQGGMPDPLGDGRLPLESRQRDRLRLRRLHIEELDDDGATRSVNPRQDLRRSRPAQDARKRESIPGGRPEFADKSLQNPTFKLGKCSTRR